MKINLSLVVPVFSRYCSIAMGSASELEYHMILGKDLGHIRAKDYQELSRANHRSEEAADSANPKDDGGERAQNSQASRRGRPRRSAQLIAEV